MTKEQLHEIVNKNNRVIRNQRDVEIGKLLYVVVEIQCKKNGWNPTEFFREGGEGNNELQSTPPKPRLSITDEREHGKYRRVSRRDARVEALCGV